MKDNNCAYDQDYLKHREKYNYIFCNNYFVDDETFQIADERFKVTIKSYLDETKDKFNYNVECFIITIQDISGKILGEYKNLSSPSNFIRYHKHINGQDLLYFSIGLYGYSVLNLNTLEVMHYVPASSFRTNEESFIWTDISISPAGNYLAVEGCYWAYPYGVRVVDISEPMIIPYRILFDSYNHSSNLALAYDVDIVKWNSDESLIIKNMNENKNLIVEYEVNINNMSIINFREDVF